MHVHTCVERNVEMDLDDKNSLPCVGGTSPFGDDRKVNRVALARPSLAGLDLSSSVQPNRPRRKSLVQLQKPAHFGPIYCRLGAEQTV